MRKLILMLLAIFTLVSCGPHRMKCGPKRRCVSVEKVDIAKHQAKPNAVKI